MRPLTFIETSSVTILSFNGINHAFFPLSGQNVRKERKKSPSLPKKKKQKKSDGEKGVETFDTERKGDEIFSKYFPRDDRNIAGCVSTTALKTASTLAAFCFY